MNSIKQPLDQQTYTRLAKIPELQDPKKVKPFDLILIFLKEFDKKNQDIQ
jgi:hypothetical protein